MQICLKNTEIKSCTRSVGDCVECRPGKGITVEKMSLHQLAQFSSRINTDISELLGITEDLVKHAETSKLSRENRCFLVNRISRLVKVVKEIRNYGNTISFNLVANDLLDDELVE
jgi:hypothetical protein